MEDPGYFFCVWRISSIVSSNRSDLRRWTGPLIVAMPVRPHTGGPPLSSGSWGVRLPARLQRRGSARLANSAALLFQRVSWWLGRRMGWPLFCGGLGEVF
ncbi:hypothetical protein QFZ40_002158 [Arthrobacter pascens]|nr:hypothetical protein [Arthrobacter pascens]